MDFRFSFSSCFPLIQAGHVCGDDLDVINGQPTGCVRVSFGFASTMSDVINVVNFIENCFVQGREKLDAEKEYQLLLETHEDTDVYFDAVSEVPGENCDETFAKDTENTPKDDTERTKLEVGTEAVKSSEVSGSGEVGTDGEEDLESRGITFCQGDDSVVLKRIILYPVKSCAGFEVIATSRLENKR